VSFKSIFFGKSDAKKEKYLLIDAFYDEGYVNKLVNQDKYLVLGPKGSGKSALAYKILLDSVNDLSFVKIDDLSDFEYNLFSEIIHSKEDNEIKYPINWEVILFIALLDSFSKDDTCTNSEGIPVKTLIEHLKKNGILPCKNLSDLVKTTSKKSKIGLQFDGLTAAKSTDEKPKDVDIRTLLTTMREVCYSVNVENKHIIIIDDLDYVLIDRKRQLEAISALIYAADKINTNLYDNDVDAKIIILCRTDLFNKLKITNSVKIKRDSGILLNWYNDTKNPENTNLYKLVNKRAEHSLKRNVDIFNEFIPKEVYHEPTVKTILDHTRHIPRDIIELLNSIQQSTEEGKNPDRDSVLNGIRSYSIEYFIDEIRNELTWFVKDEHRENFFKLLASVGKSQFTYNELIEKQKEDSRYQNLNIDDLLDAFYECSAIGNFKRGAHYTNDQTFFKYRIRTGIKSISS
jgi:hypothetical protein